MSPSVAASVGEINFNDDFVSYTISPSPSQMWKHRHTLAILNAIEKRFGPDVVFTLFGPSYWKPQSLHVCGFALAQHLYKESPYFRIISSKERFLLKIKEVIKMRSFRRDCNYWITETKDVADRLSDRLKVPRTKVFTVSNVYNQVFDQQSRWKEPVLPSLKGFKLITISTFHLHKNLTIIPPVIDYLTSRYPRFEFTFILTVDLTRFSNLSDRHKRHLVFLGEVSIDECPCLYGRSDALFMPTLLECFTVSYLEAMKMRVPILTSDLPFAHSICGDAAVYFDPLNPEHIGDIIYSVANNIALLDGLVDKGKKRLSMFGTAKSRAQAYLDILEGVRNGN